MSHAGNDEIIDNEMDNLCEGFAETYEPTINPKDYPNVSALFGNYQKEKKTYYELIKHFEYLLESDNYRDQVISFMVGHFEKHLTEDLLQELKDSLRL